MQALKEITRHYAALCARVPIKPIRTAEEHDHAVTALNALLDAGASVEDHSLADLTAVLGGLIHDYEETQLRSCATPASVLRFLMAQHSLSQSDMSDVGSQGVVSEILAGKRALNVRQIRLLARRFGVSPSVFFERDM